jgi:hypothetical protein
MKARIYQVEQPRDGPIGQKKSQRTGLKPKDKTQWFRRPYFTFRRLEKNF